MRLIGAAIVVTAWWLLKRRVNAHHPMSPLPLDTTVAHRRYRLKLYHGTSWSAAMQIKRHGFAPSPDGCLGPGVYLAQEDKARRFAQNSGRHGGHGGNALITVRVTIHAPKFVRGNDNAWSSEGYDACRTDYTSASTNMEWCVSSPSQCRVVKIERV